jgi:RNA polymerase sigma-70 factor (ECF subfamily)
MQMIATPQPQSPLISNSAHGVPFDLTLEQMRPALARFTMTQGVPAAACDDVVQETCLIVWQNRHHLRDRERFRSWIFGICLNVCRHHLRAQRAEVLRLVPLDESDPDSEIASIAGHADDAEDPAEWLDRQDLEALLDRAIAHLPPAARAVIMLADLQEMPHHEAAERLAITLSAFEARLSRSREKLRQILRTTLRAEAEAFGVFADEDLPGEWKPSRIWCFNCGRHRLTGGFFAMPDLPGAIDFRMRCPACGPIVNSGGGMPLAGVRAFKPVLNRLMRHVNHFFIQTIAQGGRERCYVCGDIAWVGYRHRSALRMPLDLAGEYWLVYDCPRCGESATAPILGCADQAPLQEFIKRHPRCVLEPAAMTTWQGAAAIVHRLTDRSGPESMTLITSASGPDLLAAFAG